MSSDSRSMRTGNEQITSPRDIPSLDMFLADDRLAEALTHLSRIQLADIARSVFLRTREALTTAKSTKRKVTYDLLITETLKQVHDYARQRLTRVINCTGVIAHTNLGRAPLSAETLAHTLDLITGYQTLEFDINTGSRGKRGLDVEADLCALTGAESALIVNNCAGALFLLLNTLSNRKETILSRGEMVQIGGGFRVPDVMRRSGAKLVEIGTTNITTAEDYKQALTPKTALLLKVSRSNFAQEGFTGEASIKELVSVADEHALPVVYDLGSGLVVNPADVNLVGYPSVIGALRDGADAVCFSGDKLFGSAQGGLIVGKEALLGKLRKSPLYRALRPDKTTLALLAQTVHCYLNDTWREEIPLWKMALRSDSDLYQFGRALIEETGADDNLTLTATSARYGAGSVPTATIPSCAICVETTKSAKTVARMFREQDPPVIGRIEDDKFLLDLRTVAYTDKPSLLAALKAVLHKL